MEIKMKHALIIGDGWVANNRHKPAFAKLGVKYHAYDIKHHENKVLQNNNYDFALLSTPPQSRLATLKACINAGIKTIFLEKPLAHTLSDAEEIKSLIDANGISARSCHNFLFSRVGNAILNAKDIRTIVFYQLNRADRQFPAWIYQLDHGIGLDEFPHMGYLARAISREHGLLDPKIRYIDDALSSVNKWQIEYSCNDGFVTCDLWRDAVYINIASEQRPYWQYKEEWNEGKTRITSVVHRVFSRLVRRIPNDFGTNQMWKCFLNNTLSDEQNKLTSIDLSLEILNDFLKTKAK